MSDHDYTTSAGDEIAAIYDRHGEIVYSFALTMLRDPAQAAEATVDVFTSVSGEISEVASERGRLVRLLRSARQEIRREGWLRKVVGSDLPVTGAIVAGEGLSQGPRQAGLRAQVWHALDSLSQRDRELMFLHLVAVLPHDDVAEIMGIDEANTPALVARMRERVDGALGALLVANFGGSECDELPELHDVDAIDADVRSRLNRHLARCETCRERREVLLSPGGALPGIILVTPPDGLRDTVVGPPVAPPDPRPAEEVSGRSDLAMWAVFGIITVALGLIGMMVGDSFAPLQPVAGPGTTQVGGDGSGASTTSTTIASQTTTTADLAATTTVGGTALASLEIETSTIDFGADEVTGGFTITNSGAAVGTFNVSASSPALILAGNSGEVAPGESLDFDVNLDRDVVAEGEIDEAITVTWEGGQATIPVTGTHLDNPIIHAPGASPSSLVVDGAGCSPTTATVSARITDSSAFTAVVRWSPDGGRTVEQPMSGVGNDIYEATVGPFSAAQTAELRIVATDEVGNAGGTSLSVPVDSCP